jgi:hypothetical protein
VQAIGVPGQDNINTTSLKITQQPAVLRADLA